MSIGDTPIVEILAVVFMLLCGKISNKAVLACAFVILIESITIFYHAYLDIYFNYLVLFYAYIAVIFCKLALKSSYFTASPYLLYVAAYFLLAIEDTFMEWGVIISDNMFYGNYSLIMYGCLAFLVYSVTYDTMGAIRLRADGNLS